VLLVLVEVEAVREQLRFALLDEGDQLGDQLPEPVRRPRANP